MGNKKICEFCGTEYDDMLPKCPYCDSTNYKGAEAEYLNKLEDVRDDMEDLEEVPGQEVKKAFQKQGRFLAIVFAILAVIVALIVGIVIWSNSQYKTDEKAAFLWREENFPILDRLYEEGRYDELMELYRQALNEAAPVGTWDHFDFCSAYESVMLLQDTYHREASGEVLDEIDYAGMLYDQWQVIGIPVNQLDEQELEILEPYIELTIKDFDQRWNMSEEDYNTFYHELETNKGLVSYDACKEYIKKWYKEK